MTEPHVPIPKNVPAAVSLEWSPSCSSLVVWCSRCKSGAVLYSTLLVRDPDTLARSVDEHRTCKRKKP